MYLPCPITFTRWLPLVVVLINGSLAIPFPQPPADQQPTSDPLNPKYLSFLAGDTSTKDQTVGVSSLMLPGFGRSRGPKPLAAPTDTVDRVKDAAAFASIPYCGNSDTLMQLNCGPKCQLPQVRDAQVVRVIERDSNLVVVADRPSENAMVVSFRGTANDANWLDNLELNRIDWPFNQPVNVSSRFTVHKGFTDAYSTVRNETMAAVQQHLAQNPNRTLLLTGHSLGGALAAMAALDMVAGNMITASRVDLVTYGTPRVGDRAFAGTMSSTWFRTMQRVVSGRDLIPHIPARAMGYQQLEGEVFVKSDQVLACTGPEDPACSNAQVPLLSLVAHGQFISGAQFFGLMGCATDTQD